MPLTSVITRRTLKANTEETVTIPLSNSKSVFCQIDADLIEFDDPSLVILLKIEFIDNLGRIISGYGVVARIIGGARGKDGEFPHLEIKKPDSSISSAKITIISNLNKTIGVTGELRTKF